MPNAHSPLVNLIWIVCQKVFCPTVFQAKATQGQGRVVLQFHEITTCKGMNPPFELKNASISRSKLGANSMNADFFNHKLAKSFSKVLFKILNIS